jgi:hypothetical protein
MAELADKYLEYAEMTSELASVELRSQNIRRLMEEIKTKITNSYIGECCGLELSAHAFKQLSERLEKLAIENTVIYEDVFNKPTKSEYLLLPSNLKSFIITLLSDALKKGNYKKEQSKNSGGYEYRFTIDIKKWSDDKTLQLICIVENNNVKTGYFNWV